MKYLVAVPLLVLTAVLVSCTTKNPDAVTNPDRDSVTAVCIWNGVALRDKPSEKGKFITKIYLGEKIPFVSDTASEVVNGKKENYHFVTLNDGSQGWLRSNLIALNAVPAAVLFLSNVYQRPDRLTATMKYFNPSDFVVITSTAEPGWCEVKGKIAGDKWFTTGWVQAEDLTREETDVRFSALYQAILEIEDDEQRQLEIVKLLGRPELRNSPFYDLANGSGELPIHAEESEMQPLDSIN